MFHFPSWTLTIRDTAGLLVGGGLLYVIVIVTFGFSPMTTDVGYQPTQPVPFSHAIHAGELGIDCRYCHNTVEKAGHAAIPPTATCMNCHGMIHTESEKLELVRESAKTGEAIPWVRVHDLPDYAFFNHAAHLAAGVGCSSCHGRIDHMETVFQKEPLSMGWCLDCHRNPEPHIRPVDQITNMAWENDADLGAKILAERGIEPNQNCSTCHR
ncbi:Class III cytochrome C family protein [Planctomycetes bacterium Pla163]|uniref:Class III cytochrome C family protein n=1 Tax=Rohdeia mirabilis TaxID=2528008 RepID=A0A518CXX5_9BACT|nr:Class III cytochrome C family protein [Planctomycetes bacterium Pla163]